jgi:hypothetical protein
MGHCQTWRLGGVPYLIDCFLFFYPRVHTHPHTIDLWPTVNYHSKLTLFPGDISSVCCPEIDYFQNFIHDPFP